MTTSTDTHTLTYQDVQDRIAGAAELERRADERAFYGDAREALDLRARAVRAAVMDEAEGEGRR